MTTPERQLEDQLIEKLQGLKYEYRADIRDRVALEKNFRDKFESLSHVHLTDGEFQRLLEKIATPDVFTAAHTLRNRSSFTRDDGTLLNYTLVNIDEWCKNTFEVVSQLRINTYNSHHRYEVLLLINGIPVAQIECKTLAKRAVVDAIPAKHDAATGGRRFNALLATASINDAIEYYALFDALQNGRKLTDSDFVPLNIAAVFSPPADVSPDVRQIQEDLPQEQEDNKHDPEAKKKALSTIIALYNERFGTDHRIEEFDLYYQDVQKRIKDRQFPNADLPKKGREKLDLTIVVVMPLTDFDSKYLNTLYVDKNHGLIQAFSRTNRVLNDTKPYGHILDSRGLKAGEGLDESAIRAGYRRFKDQKHATEVAETAATYGLPRESLQTFVDNVLDRMIVDGEQLTEPLAALELGWRARTEKELALMADFVPLLKKRAGGRDISGLNAYEQ